MSSDLLFHQLVHAKFHEAFGRPLQIEEGGSHWSLAPSPIDPPPAPYCVVSINVLLDGQVERPTAWVFDPYDARAGAKQSIILNEDQLNALIKEIQKRVAHAAERQRDAPA